MYKIAQRYLSILLCVLLYSCGAATEEQFQEVELLNHRAFNLRYTNLDSMKFYAQKALDLAEKYDVGIAESYNNLALASYFSQDFQSAEHYYNKIQSCTKDQLELLLADIGMLKVCARSSANKRFYDFETKIRKRLRRLNEEIDALDKHARKRLTFAESDYHLSASIYYYYLQQDERAKEELEQIDSYELAASDSLQWTYYEYMMSSVEMLGGSTFEEEVKLEFDSLLRILFYARANNLIYLEANILETFVEKLLNKDWYETAFATRGASISYLDPIESDSISLCESLSRRAIECFQNYGDYYQIAGAKRALGDVLFAEERYEDALLLIEDALNDINTHFSVYNAHSSFKVSISSYVPDDTTVVDLVWMEQDSISTVPQWLANIRQSLSMVYSALGNKPASDYNRNIYLDLMDKTRQDKEQENRLEQLEKETGKLNLLFWIILSTTFVGGGVLAYFNRRWRKRNAKRIEKLSITAELCNYITSSISTEAEDQEELFDSIQVDLSPKLSDIFDQTIHIRLNEETGDIELIPSIPLSKDDEDLLELIKPYANWAYQFGSTFLHLEENFKMLEKERYSHEQHIIENKRKNLEKRTCMSIVLGITPFMDRALNEINRLNDGNQSEEQKHQRYVYIQELIEKINEYNDIMALWIKMRQGALSLHVENFGLHDLFETISKSKRAYEQKEQTLIVEESDAFVKADRALTLFMINTLCENARKYTPNGGEIHLFAKETESYVEISVKDTGIGLSEEDCRRILEEKVYDSSKIGLSGDNLLDKDVELKENKGFGFGLMNCKGIIDKYKETNSLFNVCLFNIESKLGEGSRFYFRLPKGIVKSILIIIGFLTSSICFANDNTDYQLKASSFADSIYYCNLDGKYELAMNYSDSACYYLNQSYLLQYPKSTILMGMKGGDRLAELDWWNNGVNMDYHVILDIRNETAVAALALGLWETYKTNNNGYTKLYKILGQDNTLNDFCEEMQNTTSNRTVSLVILILVILIFLVISYALFFRQELLFKINVQQVLGINNKVLNYYALDNNDSYSGNVLDQILNDVSSIHSVDGLAMCILESDGSVQAPIGSKNLSLSSALKIALKESALHGKMIHLKNEKTFVYPLIVDYSMDKKKVGSFAFVNTQDYFEKNETLLRDLILNYLSTVIYQTIIRLSSKHVDLEVAEDEKRRAIHEDNIIHIQNMMLDNCLSTLKHETMYYPNRIKQIVNQLTSKTEPEKEISLNKDMRELMSYYKDIFSVLSNCANRQLDNIKFTRSRVSVSNLQKHLEKYFTKVTRKQGLDWELNIQPSELFVIGDCHLLCYLLENIIDACIEKKSECKTPTFNFEATKIDGFVRFDFTDPRGQYTQEELNLIFYPDLERMQPDQKGKLTGIQYLTMRQIIRDHDELCRHRGCRINAEVVSNGGYKIWFTIPMSN